MLFTIKRLKSNKIYEESSFKSDNFKTTAQTYLLRFKRAVRTFLFFKRVCAFAVVPPILMPPSTCLTRYQGPGDTKPLDSTYHKEIQVMLQETNILLGGF